MNDTKIDGNSQTENTSSNEVKDRKAKHSKATKSEQPSDLVVGTVWFILFLFFMTAWMYFTA